MHQVAALYESPSATSGCPLRLAYTIASDRIQRLAYFAAAWGQTKETETALTFEDQNGKTLLKILMTGFDNEQEQQGAAAGWPCLLDGL